VLTVWEGLEDSETAGEVMSGVASEIVELAAAPAVVQFGEAMKGGGTPGKREVAEKSVAQRTRQKSDHAKRRRVHGGASVDTAMPRGRFLLRGELSSRSDERLVQGATLRPVWPEATFARCPHDDSAIRQSAAPS
jgi:hypothetical protein